MGTFSAKRLVFWFFVSMVASICGSHASASLIPVKHREGVSHGFIVLHSKDGRQLATGDMIETVEGDRVTTEVVLHFKDGSVHNETTVFSQSGNFRLVSDHLRQYGKSFPKPVDVFIDVGSGSVKVHSEKDGRKKDEQHHVDMPEDVATGLTLTLLKNIPPSSSETTVSMVTTSEKPQVVKLKIRSEGERQFWTSGQPRKAIHYVIHVDIGGVKGAIAPIVGKQPPDTHVWILQGKAPTFVKFEGPLYEGGPIWEIDLAPLKWAPESSNTSGKQSN
jgi:hypothetical protein